MRRLAYVVALSLMVMLIFVPSAGAQGGQQTATVSIQDFYFSPAQLTVEPGTTVRWVNEGSVPHNVTSTDGGPLASKVLLQPGGTYQFTFQAPGTYAYHCSIHPAMTASVTVTGGGVTTVQGGGATQTAAQPSEDADQTPPLTEQLLGGSWSTVALIVVALLGVVTGALFGWAFRGAWTFRRR